MVIGDPIVGLSLTELAVLRRIPREHAAALIAPFVEAGIVEERDGLLVVTDSVVLEAFEDWAGGGL